MYSSEAIQECVEGVLDDYREYLSTIRELLGE